MIFPIHFSNSFIEVEYQFEVKVNWFSKSPHTKSKILASGEDFMKFVGSILHH